MTFAEYSQPEGSKAYVIGSAFERESSVLTVADVIASRSEAAPEQSHDAEAGASSESGPRDEASAES